MQLLPPPRTGRALGKPRVSRAAVPEASVHRNRDPGRTEDDVDSPSSGAGDDVLVQSESESATMKLRT